MKKNILIVDDSALMRRVISDIISTDDRYEIKDYAVDGLQALDLLTQSQNGGYDAVLLDLNLPKLNGLDVLVQIQKYNLTCKVIMVSTLVKEGARETILGLERGAFDFVLKPVSARPEVREDFKNRLLKSLEIATGMADDTKKVEKPPTKTVEPARFKSSVSSTGRRMNTQSKLVTIACSTGGPKSLKEVIPFLPPSLDAPVVLVQHMPLGFTLSLAQRLDELGEMTVKEAEDGETLKKGVVYLAPGGKHILIRKAGNGEHRICLTDEPAVKGLKPNADIMFQSLCDSDYDEVTCVVMTGMGSDGTNGIAELGKQKSVYVIGQDEATCVVYGMPRAVANAGLTDEVLPLNRIADAIIKNVGVQKHGC